MREKRNIFTALALEGQDEECMEALARLFEDPRTGFMNYIYWDDLDDKDTLWERQQEDEGEFGGACTVI